MRFLADESCDFAVVRALRGAGHDVTAIREVLPGIDDERVASLALGEGRILLTEDKDVGQIAYAASPRYPGAILIRFPGNLRQNLAGAILALVRTSAVELEGAFVVLQPGRVRISGRLGK